MRYALFLGCAIPARLPAYERSTRAVLGRLGVRLVDLDFTCCGYPARSIDRDAFATAAIRNLAIAERRGLDVLAPCKCCFGSLRQAMRLVREDDLLRSRVTAALAAEGLSWSGRARVEHLLPVLAREVGVDAVAAAVRSPQAGLRVAAHYGCHALRPSDVTGFDNPMAPTLFETLVRAIGAEAVDWPRRLDCCGDPVHEANALLAGRLATAKVADAHRSGASVLATACPHCHIRFSEVMHAMPDGERLGILLYTQILGRAMGIPDAELGL